MRDLHSLLGLFLAVPLVVLALSGAALSIYPLLDAWSGTAAANASILSVGEVAGRVSAEVGHEFGYVSRIERSPSGALSVEYFNAAGRPRAELVDPATGTLLGPVPEKGALRLWIAELHRSFLLGDAGRVMAGVGAATMALISLTGLGLLAIRAGGWRQLLAPPRGDALGRFHVAVSRLATPALAFLAISGLGVALATFEVIPDLAPAPRTFRSSVTGAPLLPPEVMSGLDVPVNALRSLMFPLPDDPTDVFTLNAATGLRLVDQTTGAVLDEVPLTYGRRVFEWAYMFHSGEGLPLAGLVMAFAALSTPVLAVTGALIRLRRPGSRRIRNNRRLGDASALILVASEGGATWGFAKTLHAALVGAGWAVRTMNLGDLRAVPCAVREVLILASTYGNGDPPRGAAGALGHLARMVPPRGRATVLGFGDRTFPSFGAFPRALDAALEQAGWQRGLPLTIIDRQSSQAFAGWGNELGRLLDLPLALRHEPHRPAIRTLELVERRLYGGEAGEPAAVLGFRAVAGSRTDRLRGWLRGDGFGPDRILGVVAPEASVPRFYSISSAPSRNEVELCVRLVPGGCASPWLHGLRLGDRIEAFARGNPSFVPPPGRTPLILVGAGTGIAPLMGMIRANDKRRPLHLFWGGRSPSTDFLYEHELGTALTDGRLASLATAFSRAERRAWVQDRLRERPNELVEMIKRGGGVMVCGAAPMAAGVAAEFEAALAPHGLHVSTLKAQGRWAEDVF